MKSINVNTKIAAILKQDPKALDAIVSISPKFIKLKNPILRRVMAPRISIAMACKVGNCSVIDFFEKLQSIGFIIDKDVEMEEVENASEAINIMPDFIKNSNLNKIVELDVRSEIESGKDPLSIILNKIKQIKPDEILKLINSFEPIPLIQLLNKKGFTSYIETVNDNLVYCYFQNTKKVTITEPEPIVNAEDWEAKLKQFENNLVSIDVRKLEMPLPMMTILEELDKLPKHKALFVFHKRIPIFLLPELAERNFDYRAKQINEDEVNLLIYKE